ncbi:finger family [Acanthamoeba polyphaga mimivirus]|uniref:Finger family n=2 Tax=Megamimivirinae TaxID=3044648 RepID=A0A2L2DI76_MIMIV|nr:hypothetical protein MegaChil _gp0123 [Megavirus chiliensis]AEQ32830.1 hypothetical protein [Megavirus chiliensis]AVG45859.1 finger family [Acanthamoeba polyphaga mimivirus]AVG46962.1 finger family [Acanthamoeba polyphaga mimivirus]
MCDCDIDSSEIFKGNICLAEDEWLLHNNYYFGDYIYIDCDFCTNMKEYPDIRICPKCEKYICYKCDKSRIILPDKYDIDIGELATYFIRFLVKNKN